MKILSRMYLIQNLKVLVLTVVAVISLSILFEFFEVVKSAGKTGASMGRVFQYLLYVSPRYAVFALPLGVLLSSMVVLGMAVRKRELTAIRSLGASVRRVSLVFVAMGLVWSVFTYLLSEYVIPETSRKAVHIRTVEIMKKKSRLSYMREKLWLRMSSGGIAEIDVISGNRLRGISIYEFEKGMKRRIEASVGEWKNGRWVLQDVRVLSFKDGSMTEEFVDLYEAPDIPAPQVLGEEQRQPDEMNFTELRTYARSLEKAGIRADQYRVTLYSKMSFPLVCLAMALLGTGLAIREQTGGARFRVIALCTAVIVAYWGLHMLTLSLGYVGRLPPLASAWLTPLGFLAGGIFVFVRSERIG